MAKKSGAANVLLKVLLFIIFLVLLANFCWDGKPLYKVLFPGVDRGVAKTVDKLENTTKSGIEKAKDTVVDKAQELKEEIKEKVTGDPEVKSEFPKEDREKLDRIIKDAEKKKK